MFFKVRKTKDSGVLIQKITNYAGNLSAISKLPFNKNSIG